MATDISVVLVIFVLTSALIVIINRHTDRWREEGVRKEGEEREGGRERKRRREKRGGERGKREREGGEEDEEGFNAR